MLLQHCYNTCSYGIVNRNMRLKFMEDRFCVLATVIEDEHKQLRLGKNMYSQETQKRMLADSELCTFRLACFFFPLCDYLVDDNKE